MVLENIVDEMIHRYVVTAAQRGATPNHKFLDALELYADKNDAEIMVVPIDGQYREDDRLADRFNDYNVVESYKFSPHFLLADFPVKAQQIRPLTGLPRFVQGDKSAVFGSPKQHLECIANSNIELPKILTTTGAATKPKYKTHLRIGNIANRDHTHGALVVEVDDITGMFQYRHVTADSRGSFIDIDKRYSPDGKVSQTAPNGLVLGDIHTYPQEDVWEETLNLIRDTKPKYIIVHDLMDSGSVSHHNQYKCISRAMVSAADRSNLYKELYDSGERLAELWGAMPDSSRIVVVKSNHDEHLERYLNEGRFINDPENLRLSCDLAAAMLDGKDPLKEGIEMTYGSFGKYVKWLGRDEDFKIRGVQVGAHGDLGGNGSRGSRTQQQNNYGRSVVAHRHTPGILGDAYCVGTSTPLKLDYNRGPSSWMHTHGLVHENGKIQLINIIDGKYKF